MPDQRRRPAERRPAEHQPLPLHQRRRTPRASVSLIVPTLNEVIYAPVLLADAPAWIDEVIVVDGRSTDGTLEAVAAACPRAVCLTQPGRGKGDAIKAGLAAATGDVLVTMDADGSMSLVDAERLVDKLLTGFDFVKGSRALPGGGSADFTPARRFGSWALTKLSAGIFGARYTDITYGFNAYWNGTILDPTTLSDGFQFEVQLAVRAVRAGLRTAEVSCFEEPRVGGESKVHAALDGWRILKAILAETAPRRRCALRAMADVRLAPRGASTATALPAR